MKFSWQALPTPFCCLAPMEGATDAAFRQIVATVGTPQVMFTEFVNVDGLASKGKRNIEQALWYDPVEQPLIAQLWGVNPENFHKAAREIVERGFAGVDINMGCPDRAVIKRGAGGALIHNYPLVKEIISAVKSGVNEHIPVSVKIRIGFKQIITEEWAGYILDQGIDALTVHGRTVAELSKVPAHWDEIGKVAELKNRKRLKTVIIGNGDVTSLVQADVLAKQYGVDGVMIGRGVFQNPWFFDRNKSIEHVNRQERIHLLLSHLDKYQSIFCSGNTQDHKPFEPMKRYFKIYIQSFPGAVELRTRLMACKGFEEARSLLTKE